MIYTLCPRIVRAYDFARKIDKPSDEYERLISGLDRRFRDSARTDMYGDRTGWLDRGVQDSKIREINGDGERQVLPVLG